MVGDPQLGALLSSVVRVMTVADPPDYEQPWQTAGPGTSTGSGAIIDTAHGLRILTNAHCVANHVFVEVRRYGQARKHVAEVSAIGHECDLALLSVDEPTFFEGVTPIPIGGLPQLGDRVQLCGYPIGGERLSIAEGLVSRIELVRYAQSQRRLLAVQVDAAINAGNSGGRVLGAGELVGVAFQALEGADRIGHSIAAPVVEHFLKDVEDGIYDGFPGLGVAIQRLESESHRRSLGLPEGTHGGVLVTRVAHGGSSWEVLRPGDVLLSVDGVEIAADGTVPLRDGELVGFEYVISGRQVGEAAALTVWRDGRVTEHTVTLREPSYLVAEDRYDVPPSYYVFGGLLFVPLTRDYLETWGSGWWQDAPHELLGLYQSGLRTPEREEPVVLQKVLADRVNQGYHGLGSVLIARCQGRRVRSLAHLVALVESSTDDFVRFESSHGGRVVLDRARAIARNPAILELFGVPRDRSVDLAG